MLKLPVYIELKTDNISYCIYRHAMATTASLTSSPRNKHNIKNLHGLRKYTRYQAMQTRGTAITKPISDLKIDYDTHL